MNIVKLKPPLFLTVSNHKRFECDEIIYHHFFCRMKLAVKYLVNIFHYGQQQLASKLSELED